MRFGQEFKDGGIRGLRVKPYGRTERDRRGRVGPEDGKHSVILTNVGMKSGRVSRDQSRGVRPLADVGGRRTDG
jgi:hypothetical protein